MKKQFTVLVMTILLAVVLVCYGQAEDTRSSQEADRQEPALTETNAPEEEKNTVYFPQKNPNSGGIIACFGSLSTSVREMYEKAHTVIVATVVKDDAQWYDTQVAQSEVVVEEVWKGDCSVGDTLIVNETGLRFDDHDASIGGEPILRKDMHVILFLTQDYDGIRGICDAYQGKMFLNEQELAYPFSYYVEDDGTEFASFSDMTEPISLDDVRQMLTE